MHGDARRHEEPDADCRRRLFDLYGRGLTLQLADREKLIARTEGVSGAFIRELLRKAAVFAAEEGQDGALVVADNVLSHPDALAGYSARRQADPGLLSVTVPLDNGLEMTSVLTE